MVPVQSNFERLPSGLDDAGVDSKDGKAGSILSGNGSRGTLGFKAGRRGSFRDWTRSGDRSGIAYFIRDSAMYSEIADISSEVKSLEKLGMTLTPPRINPSITA